MRIRGAKVSACLSCLALVGACGSDEQVAGGAPDDASTAGDAASSDAASDDAASDEATPDEATTDASTAGDAAGDAIKLGPVQCQTAETCIAATGDGCFQSKPGGVCANCADPGDTCPPGTTCISGGTAGATECAYPCNSDEDCNVGLRCATTGPTAGYCSPRACGGNEPPCPSPYTFCREGECARPRCADGCPPPLYCADGGAFCLEP